MHTAQPTQELNARTSRLRLSFSSQVVPGIVVALDAIIILAGAVASYSLFVGYYDDLNAYLAAVGFVSVLSLLLMHFAGLYRLEAIMHPLTFLDKIVIASATTFLFLLAAAFSLKISSTFSRSWIASFAACACGGTIAVRLIASRVVRYLAAQRVFTRNVIIVGASAQTRRLLSRIDQSPPNFVSLLGIFADEVNADFGRYRLLGNVDAIVDYVRNHNVDDVIIALPWSADVQIMALMAKLRELPINAYLSSDLVGFRLPFRPPPDHFDDLPLVEVMGRPLAGWGGLQKAVLDYGLGIVLTILLLPLMAIIALAIRVEGAGPTLFRQERHGFVNRVFWIRKFRTMQHQAGPAQRTPQATRNDPRVTQVGRILRRTSLDELPQLFNVLNGTMSLVGPRPHAIDHNEDYSQLIRGYFARHRVKPGITGWAQVNGLRGETKTVEEMEARVRYDAHYVEHWSLWFDLRILAMTAKSIVTGRNAY